jgi:hypothetical protein
MRRACDRIFRHAEMGSEETRDKVVTRSVGLCRGLQDPDFTSSRMPSGSLAGFKVLTPAGEFHTPVNAPAPAPALVER